MKRIMLFAGLSLALVFLISACGTEAVSRPEADEATRVALGLDAEEATEVLEEVEVQAAENETEEATEESTVAPTEIPTEEPTAEPTNIPTEEPTVAPTATATVEPTVEPTEEATEEAAVNTDLVAANPTGVPSGSTPDEEVIAANVALADATNGQMLVSVVAPPCASCHNFTSETQLVGPGLYNFSERAGTRVEGQGPYTYAYNSIRYSQVHIVDGFVAGLMPSYDGVLTDDEVYDIIAYIWTLHD